MLQAVGGGLCERGFIAERFVGDRADATVDGAAQCDRVGTTTGKHPAGAVFRLFDDAQLLPAQLVAGLVLAGVRPGNPSHELVHAVLIGRQRSRPRVR